MPLVEVRRLPGIVADPQYGTIPLEAPSAPGAVRNLAVTSITHNSATVLFDAPVTGGVPTGWRARVAPSLSGPWSSDITVTASPAVVPLPAPEATFIIEIAAINVTGQGPWSPPVSATTAQAPQPPGEATALVASTIRRPSFVASWADPAGGRAATSANLRYRVQGTTPWTTVTGFAKGAALTGLTPGAAYEWQVQMANDAGVSAWSSVATTTTVAQFAVPAVANLADWRNMMESVEAAQKNWVTGATVAMVGTPVKEADGIRVKASTNYFPGVPEKPTQTFYWVGRLVGPISANGNRPIPLGSRVSNTDLGHSMYLAGTVTDITAADMRSYGGLVGGASVSGRAHTGTFDMSKLCIFRSQVIDGAGAVNTTMNMKNATHPGTEAPGTNAAARKVSATPMVNYGSDNGNNYQGECISTLAAAVDGVPSVQEDAAIVAAIRAEMAYWGVAEGT